MPQPKSLLSKDNLRVLLFVIVLCFVCGALLAVVAALLAKPQEEARSFDRSVQMLKAARVLSPEGSFLVQEGDAFKPGFYDAAEKKILPALELPAPQATREEIKTVATARILPFVTNSAGELFSLQEKNIDLDRYLSEYKRVGYATQPLKLVYAILPNGEHGEVTGGKLPKVEGLVFPVSGYGLWGPIYGYLAIAPDGDHVLGTSWYEHGETPGLGANITEPWWQKQFFGKVVFQEGSDGKTNFATAPMGITVVKGRVADVLGSAPKAKSAVDGMSGATLTGDGVTAAYKDSMTPYRRFLIAVQGHKE